FNALNDAIPDFNGLVAMVDAKYIISATRVQARVDRDLNFSYDGTHPYYALTDVNLQVTEGVTRSWGLGVRGGWQTLDYRQLEALQIEGRTDRGHFYGGGVGRRVGEALRVGLDVNYLVRRSQDFSREY